MTIQLATIVMYKASPKGKQCTGRCAHLRGCAQEDSRLSNFRCSLFGKLQAPPKGQPYPDRHPECLKAQERAKGL